MKRNTSNPSRRQFLKGILGGLGAAAAARVSGLFPEGQQVLASQIKQAARQVPDHEVGELYAGFLILPHIDSLPNVLFEGLPLDERQITEFASLAEALNQIEIPLYLPSTLPNGIEFSKVSIQSYPSSTEVYLVSLSYASSEIDNPYPINISALTDFPRPYPVRPVHLFQDSGEQPELISPDRVSFTPTQGVMLPSVLGYVLQWIENGILYTLVSEHNPSRDAAIELVNSLEKYV